VLTLSAVNTYSGPTTVNGGTFRLRGDTGTIATNALTINFNSTFDIDANATVAANPNRIPDATVVTFNGGTFSMEAPANINRTETVATLIFNSGDNSVILTPNGTRSVQLNSTNAFQRNNAATLNYTMNAGEPVWRI